MLDLELIRIDGGTQIRAELNQETVDAYAEAYAAGAKFPPVTVFYDGKDRWLADGFHRFFAAKKAGKTSILENITPGTKRDAILFSLGANGAHGLNRTNADKRNAVETMLQDPEWSAWSDNAIAKACLVDHKTVAARRIAILGNSQDAPTTRTVERNGKTYEQNTANIGKQPAPVAKPAAALPPTVPEDDGPSAEELAANAMAQAADAQMVQKLLESDAPLAAAMEENKRLNAEVAHLKQRMNGLMNEKNEAIVLVKARDRQIAKLEKLLQVPA